MSEHTFSSVEVCKAAGVTYRQLDYWNRIGLVEPHVPAEGSGSHRRYTLEDLSHVVACARLMEVGVPPQIIRERGVLAVAAQLADVAAEVWELIARVPVG
jgi:DNA-binding transcriptional MerR regulator